jgi:hypothetical protein
VADTLCVDLKCITDCCSDPTYGVARGLIRIVACLSCGGHLCADVGPGRPSDHLGGVRGKDLAPVASGEPLQAKLDNILDGHSLRQRVGECVMRNVVRVVAVLLVGHDASCGLGRRP